MKCKQNPKITSKHISREITATVNVFVCVSVCDNIPQKECFYNISNQSRDNINIGYTGHRTNKP
jgi:hypothetical protein